MNLSCLSLLHPLIFKSVSEDQTTMEHDPDVHNITVEGFARLFVLPVVASASGGLLGGKLVLFL